MGMFMRMIGPVPVRVGMHDFRRGQLRLCMGMRPFEMMSVIVAAPGVLWAIVGYQQALAMMPAIAENVVILLAFGGPFFFAQTIPFAVRVLNKAFSNRGRRQDTIAGGLEEKTVVNVHQAIEAETLVDGADFGQQGSAKSHQI